MKHGQRNITKVVIIEDDESKNSLLSLSTCHPHKQASSFLFEI